MTASDPFTGATALTRAVWDRISSRSWKPPPAELVWRVEDLQRRAGGRVSFLSGYRSAADNRRVGGKRLSRHRRGDAIDIAAGVVTVDQALRAGFRGIGHRRGWVVHLDCRPARRPVIFPD